MKRLRQQLMAVLAYDSNTGIFTWKASQNGRGQKGGKIAGYVQNGYVVIEHKNAPYKAHRLAWLFMTGAWPKEELDHINRIPADNRFCNLREATKSQNLVNVTKRKNNKSGHIGVSRRGDKWGAYVNINKRRVHLGVFDSFEQACAARQHALKRTYGAFAPESIQ